MSIEIGKSYQPEKNEKKIYQLWEKSGFFNPDKLPVKKTAKKYAITIPPPNITGRLHMGHALNAFIQDILIRWKRMQGYHVLWVPGTDHAGIATQNIVEKELKKEGLTRYDLGREQFIKRVWQWKKEYGYFILDQLKQLGCSCDWSRAAFTMDPSYQKAVEETFLYYHKKGWIYQGERVINWCPRCQTSLSDLELEYKEKKGFLWHIKYPIKNSRKYLVVATTRPETMLGDTAVAVNPKDKRYRSFVGKKIILPLAEREIPIVADQAVEINFGSGAVKVTPAHSMVDAEIAQRHNLPFIQVISDKASMTKQAGRFASLNIKEAREKIIEELKKENLLEKTEPYNYPVPYCDRCDNLIEHLLSKQWFLKMDQLAQKAIKAVKSGRVKFHPKRWEKVYLDWLENIKDWCISRQIWWGHKIPIEGEEDVLDTWFSSALWPFATLGWPEKSKDFEKFYPTDVLSTARDIINLWVARMVFSGLELTEKPPFKDVIIHATILTKDGKRMSKSLGTGIDPLELIDRYGSDAVRFGMIYQALSNQDIHFVEDHIQMGKKFANKVWNASRFALQKIDKKTDLPSLRQVQEATFSRKITAADKKIIKQLSAAIKKVDQDLSRYRFGQAAHTAHNFFWRHFCDQYIEASKKQEGEESKQVLACVLTNSLKMLHPFMPFVTEAIYQKLPFKKEMFLMVEKWPN